MIALVVATHGAFSREIVKSAEMIFGRQENVAAVTFSPGEGPDDLARKYHQVLSTLDRSDGTLFLVDLFGGSPFNAAVLVASQEERTEVIAGINMPMLIGFFEKRNAGLTNLDQMIQSISQTGVEGVRRLNKCLAVNTSDEGDEL